MCPGSHGSQIVSIKMQYNALPPLFSDGKFNIHITQQVTSQTHAVSSRKSMLVVAQTAWFHNILVFLFDLDSTNVGRNEIVIVQAHSITSNCGDETVESKMAS